MGRQGPQLRSAWGWDGAGPSAPARPPGACSRDQLGSEGSAGEGKERGTDPARRTSSHTGDRAAPRVGGGFPWWGDCPSGALPAPPGRQAAGSPLSSPAPARPPPRRLGEKPRCSVQRFSRRLPGAGGGRAVFSPFSSEATESQPLPGVRNGASLERSAGPDVESNTPASSLPPACVRPRETARGLRRGFGLGP